MLFTCLRYCTNGFYTFDACLGNAFARTQTVAAFARARSCFYGTYLARTRYGFELEIKRNRQEIKRNRQEKRCRLFVIEYPEYNLVSRLPPTLWTVRSCALPSRTCTVKEFRMPTPAMTFVLERLTDGFDAAHAVWVVNNAWDTTVILCCRGRCTTGCAWKKF